MSGNKTKFFKFYFLYLIDPRFPDNGKIEFVFGPNQDAVVPGLFIIFAYMYLFNLNKIQVSFVVLKFHIYLFLMWKKHTLMKLKYTILLLSKNMLVEKKNYKYQGYHTELQIFILNFNLIFCTGNLILFINAMRWHETFVKSFVSVKGLGMFVNMEHRLTGLLFSSRFKIKNGLWIQFRNLG